MRDEVARPALAPAGAGPVPAGRVLLVAGRPGSGRTALAVRFARSIAADYPDGQFFVRMSEPDGAPVAAAVAARLLLDALGVPAAPSGPEQERSDEDCALLRTELARRRVLLVLDDVQQAEQVRALLPGAEGCLLVAVTAGPLTGLVDARPCVISGLDHRAATAVLVGLAGDTRIVCDPVAARTLAERLACQPAALRLAAGWLRARPRASVSDVLRLLADHAHDERPAPRVDLDKRPGAAEPGTEPLLRAFELVHAGLPAPAARLLRLLLLAPGTVADPRTASALLGCPVDAAATHLATLAEQELLRPTGLPQRYRLPGCLHPVLKALLARDRASETELARARVLERLTRLLTACLHQLAPGAGPAPEPLPGPLRFGGRAEAWAWLDTELPVLRAALRTAAGDGALDGLAMRLATALVRALPLWAGGSGPVTADLYALHETVLELSLRGGLRRQQAGALVNLGDLHAAAGEHVRALERYRAALGPARAAADQVAVARILEAVAGAYRASGDLVRASDWYGRALVLRRSRGESLDEVRLLGRLAAAHTAQGRLADALRDYRAAAALHRKLGAGAEGVAAMLGAARVQEFAGNTEHALRTQREALAAVRETGLGVRVEVQVLLRMAEALERAGDPAGARAQREQAAVLAVVPARRPEPEDGGAEPVIGAGEDSVSVE